MRIYGIDRQLCFSIRAFEIFSVYGIKAKVFWQCLYCAPNIVLHIDFRTTMNHTILLISCLIFACYTGTVKCIIRGLSYGSKYGSGSVSKPSGCGVPNVIQGQYIDPEKIMGTWYSYTVYFPNVSPESIPLNTVNYYTSLGRGHFPTTDIAAYIATQEQTFYSQNNDTACQYLHEACYFTVDGRQIGIYFNLSNTESPVSIDNSIFWTTDYDLFAVFHSCFKPNWNTGICDFPYLYVNTRKKPQDVSVKEKRKIDDAVNYHTRRYCLDHSDFLPFEWIDALPSCPRTTGNSCFRSIVPAFQATVEEPD